MRSAIAMAALVLLAACGQQQSAEYPPQYEFNFMQGCQASRSAEAQALCTCIWTKVEREIPVRDFEAYEQLSIAARETHPLTAQIQSYGTACAAAPAPAAAPSGN